MFSDTLSLLLIIIIIVIISIIIEKIRSNKYGKAIKLERKYGLQYNKEYKILFKSKLYSTEVFEITPTEPYIYECIETEYYNGTIDIGIVAFDSFGNIVFKAILKNAEFVEEISENNL